MEKIPMTAAGYAVLETELKRREAEYLLLGELNTKPRTSYLPRVRNPNPEWGG